MKNKILNVASILFGLMFINSGLNKFLQYMPVPNDLPPGLIKVSTAMMTIGWFMPLVGIVEIIAGVLVLFPKTRALGAIMILPIMVGIMLIHTINAPSGLIIASVLFLINIWIIIENRHKYLPMLTK